MKALEKLPVDSFYNEIMESESPYIIVEAETGSGKSTRIPLWFYEKGQTVLVTEPLISAVRRTSQFVAQLAKVPFGTYVGYRTSESQVDSPSTRLLFCTDGLALVRSLSRRQRFDMLVIDELHEWNTNQSTLEAWAWKHLQDGDSQFKKVIVLSATLDSDELSRQRGNAPVFKIPGRQYEIEDRQPKSTLVDDISSLVREGFDVLVFQPGKREIAETISDLESIKVKAELIPYHGELPAEEQDKAFQSYARPRVVVSTNALESGQTMVPSPGRKLAVVDSGQERRIELRNGIETLVLAPVPLAKAQQRRGRTGRVGQGVYIDHCPAQNREAYPVPEIRRTRLDQMVLRLAVVGYDATELPFFHQVDEKAIREAKRALFALGALTESGDVTLTGRQMAKLPVSVQYSRMIVEADKRGVLDEVVTIAAMLEYGGISDRTGTWRTLVPEETESDLLAQLELWRAAQSTPIGKLRDKGIFANNFRLAKEMRWKIFQALPASFQPSRSAGKREDILRACVAGMVDHLYHREGEYYYNGGSGGRQLARESVIPAYSEGSEWLVGLPRDIQFKDRRGYLRTLRLVTMATKVNPTWLVEVAPQLASTSLRNYRYDRERARVVADEVTVFNGQEVGVKVVDALPGAEATETLIRSLAYAETGHPAEAHNASVRETLADLARRSDGLVSDLTFDQVQNFYRERIGQATSLADIAELHLELSLEDYAPADIRQEIDRTAPKTIAVLGADREVTYRHGATPKVALPKEVLEDGTWQQLPDEGLQLPDGRVVEAEISYGWYNAFRDTNIPALKVQIRNHLNQSAWDNWRDRPEIVLPKVEEDRVEVAPVLQATYGQDAVDGTPLIAYGVPRLRHRYYSEDPYFEGQWYRTRTEADEARAAVLAKIDEIKVELAAQQRLVEVKERAEAVSLQATETYNRTGGYYNSLPQEMADRLYQARTLPYRADADQLEDWIVEIQELLAEVAVAEKQTTERRQAAEAVVGQAKERVEAFSKVYYGSQSYVSYEDLNRVKSLLAEAEYAFGNRNYGVAEAKANETVDLTVEILAAGQTRRDEAEAEAAQEQSELAPILQYVKTVEEARRIRAFAEAVGNRRLLQREYNAPYGRGRRQAGIRSHLNQEQLLAAEVGAFLNMSKAAQVDSWLAGAIAWLGEESEPSVIDEAPLDQDSPMAQAFRQAMRQRR